MRWNSEVSRRGSMSTRWWRRVGSRFLDGWSQAGEGGDGKIFNPASLLAVGLAEW